MLELIAIFTVAILNLTLGLFVFTRNPRSPQNRAFAFFAVMVSLWGCSNFLSNVGAPESKLFFNRFSYTVAMLSILALLIFSLLWPKRSSFRLKDKISIFIAPIFFVLSLTPMVVMNYVVRPGQQATDIESGPLYLVFVGYIVLIFIFACVNFRKMYMQSNVMDKTRIQFTSIGIGLSFTWVVITSAIVPYFTGDWDLSMLGPLGTIIMIAAIAYAIIRHRLFDIRLVVARSLAYILSLSTLAVSYAILVAVFTQNIFIPDNLQFIRAAVPFASAIFVAVSFGPIKRYFNKLTNKYFYQDAYEPQRLLNELNSSLVSLIDVSAILKDTSLLIEHYLKPSYVMFFLNNETGHLQKSFSTQDQDVKLQKKVYGAAQKFEQKVTGVSYDLELDHDLHEEATQLSMGLVAQLASNTIKDHRTGYIVLGTKKSGGLYGKADYRVMEIIADELVIALQNALRFEEIQAFNVTLQDKVDDATRKLRKANEKLVALDQTKDDFISMASHQLRTPLTSVKGYVSMVIEGDVGKVTKQQKKLLDQAYVSSQRMVYLIADLLNVSRLKTGKFVIDTKPTNLAELVEGELSQLRETAQARELELTYKKPKDFPTLNLDETKIRQVVMNFADNAIYYTPAGGHIIVSVEDKGESIEFTVADDGIGVPKAEQHNLFSKFYRAENAKKARPDGTGLGLFMAKKVIVAQGGALIFKSVEGKGSTFGFSFSKKALSKPGTTTTTDDET